MINFNLNKYIYTFVAVSMAVVVIGTIVCSLLGIDGNSAVAIASTVTATFAAATKFVKAQNRLPSSEEKHTLAWKSVLLSQAAAILFLVLVLLAIMSSEEINELMSSATPLILILSSGVLAFLLLIQYLLVRWLFGRVATQYLRQMSLKRTV